MRYVFSFGFALALGLALMAGCSDSEGPGGDGGTGGTAPACGTAGMGGEGGAGGEGGSGGVPACQGPDDCQDGQPFCTEDDCDPVTGMCVNMPVADGTECYGASFYGVCVVGVCRQQCEIDPDCVNDLDPCTVDTCDPVEGLCEYEQVEDGTECYGASFYGVCVSGVCRQQCEIDPDCVNDLDPCTVDTCDPVEGLCEYEQVEDGTVCGEFAVCVAGSCRGLCEYEQVEDGTVCGESAVCVAGSCRDLECQVSADCDDFKDCTSESCVSFGFCRRAILQDGCSCAGGVCDDGECALESSKLPCTEQGIRNAIAAGGGPYTFACDGRTTVVTQAEIVIDHDVILDGEGNLTVDGNANHRVLSIPFNASVELQGLTVSGGFQHDSGGGIYNSGTLALTSSTVSGNSVSEVGYPGGGGIYNAGTLTMKSSTVSGNSGGAIFDDEGVLTLIDSAVSGNTAVYCGGGIRSLYGALTLINSTVSENEGCGILFEGIDDYGTLTLMNSTVSRNSGEGIYQTGGTLTLIDSTVSGNIGAGGINSSTLTTTLINSTVSGNTAHYLGAGIVNFPIAPAGGLMLVNSTVSGNTGGSAQGGGGIHSYGEAVLINSTVSGNASFEGGAGIYHESSSPFVLSNSIIDDDCYGTLVVPLSGGGNIESPGNTCGFDQATDQVSVTAEELKLGPLADNGGPTMTHALGAGSVAIDQIPAEDCLDSDGQPLTTDQRGEPRPETGGTMCDVGAYELQP